MNWPNLWRVACQHSMLRQHGCRAIETAATRDARAQAAHALLHIMTRKPCQCGESSQYCRCSSMEAAAGVNQAPMHRPALQREAGQGLIWRPLELHHNLQQAATGSAVSWQVRAGSEEQS